MLFGCASIIKAPGARSPLVCSFDTMAFSCSGASLSTDGKLSFTMKNEKESSAIVHKIVCTDSKSPEFPDYGAALSPEPSIKAGESYSLQPKAGMACLDSDGKPLGKVSNDFSGRAWVFYNYDADGENFPPRVTSAAIAKIS